MSAERIRLSAAIILHRRPYRDSSLLLEALTVSHGRIGLVARGRRGQALLQPFQPLLLSWNRRGELGTLSDAEVDGPAYELVGRRLLCGLYLNELLLRSLQRDDPHPEVHADYHRALAQLAGGVDEASCLRRFELRLLEALGLGLDLLHEADAGAPVSEGASYRLVAHHGLVQGPGGISGADLAQLAGEEELTGSARPASRQLLAEALEQLIGDAPLRTRRLLQQLER